MPKGLSKSFTLEFTLVRMDGALQISTYLPLKTLPPLVIRRRSDLAPRPEAVIVPRLTRPLQRLLKCMVELEQQSENVNEPNRLIAAMEKIVLTVYVAAKEGRGVPVDTLMVELIVPAVGIVDCADVAIRGLDPDSPSVSTGPRFIQLLIDAAVEAGRLNVVAPVVASAS